MNGRVFLKELLFLILFLTNSRDVDLSVELGNAQVKPVQKSLEESSSEDKLSFGTPMLSEPDTTVETTSVNEVKNVSEEFRPSVHLGEIKESRIGVNPFNNVRHIKFENGIDGESYHEHLKNFRLVFQTTEQPFHTDHQDHLTQSVYQTVLGSSEEVRKDVIEQNGYVKFPNNFEEVPAYPYYHSLKDQTPRQQFPHGVNENIGTTYDFVDQQTFHNPEKPVYGQASTTYLEEPFRLQNEAEKHAITGLSGIQPSRIPYYQGYYNHHNYQPNLQEHNLSVKPNNGLLYVQESELLRTRKFPYPYYQPQVGYHPMNFVSEEHSPYSLKKRVSPWKKILHLIGAFVPLGLLVAALTPNVVRVNNTSDPSIVLSKWRVDDLPVEHKQARLEDTRKHCEERSICDLILAGGTDSSTALQNILWNFATRTSTSVAKESGLQDIFQAVKEKDCGNVGC